MSESFRVDSPLSGSHFGGRVGLERGGSAHALVEAAERDPDCLPRTLADSHGLLLLPGMGAMADEPELLVRLSRVFGTEVEDYRQTLTQLNRVHQTVPEILVVSNTPPASRPPPRKPDPPLTADGGLPVQFPHRRGWHSDQSYRRPPPDISVFLAVKAAPQGQGQTLFADTAAAYAALPDELKERLRALEGIHVSPALGRGRNDALEGKTPRALAPHERPQRQPLVREHPVTGEPALYMCEYTQMDWFEGPIADMEPGPHGEGGRLLEKLMAHATKPEFVYVHEWTHGDVLVWDNRCLVHTATWFDADHVDRVMWRTTVRGNPGATYAGEERSWIPAAA